MSGCVPLLMPGALTESSGFCFTLDVVVGCIFPRNLNLMGQLQNRWLLSALLDSNHYMYLCFAWPALLDSGWSRLRDWLFPQMVEQSQKFEDMMVDLFHGLRNEPHEDGFYAAMQTAKDLLTEQSYSEDSIRREVKMLTRAGTI